MGCSPLYYFSEAHLYDKEDRMFFVGYKQAVEDCQNHTIVGCKIIMKEMQEDLDSR